MQPWLNDSPLVLEVVPPPLKEGERGLSRRLDRIAEVHAAVGLSAVNIPEIRNEEGKSDDGARKSSFEERHEPRQLAARVQSELGLRAVINRVVVHESAGEQCAWFRDTQERFGVRDFVLVGGERTAGTYPGPTVPQANELIRATLGSEISVGNICIPTRQSTRLNEAERMLRKLSAGVDFFTTQIIYHAEHLTRLLDQLADAPAAVTLRPMLVSLCPVRTPHSLSFLRWLGVQIERELEEQLCADPERLLQSSIDHLVELWQTILRHAQGLERCPALGLNLAPVGPIPAWATIELARRLRA